MLPSLRSCPRACGTVLQVLNLLGYDRIASNLFAGLGIGGLTIGLALQAVLRDIFGCFLLLIDRPFKVGDSICIGKGHDGVVLAIGFRTTQIRTHHQVDSERTRTTPNCHRI